MVQTEATNQDKADQPDVALEEVRLMGLVALEDVRAFETIYRAFHPRLTRFLRRMIRHGGLVEEVLDDTMMVAWRKAHTWDGTSKLSTWLFAIAYRQALKALRGVDPSVGLEGEEPVASEHSEPYGTFQRHQLRVQLDDALGRLSAEHRAVIELTYYQGYSCREIAEIMGCPVATVKTRMFYARNKLKTRLSALGELAL